jgi:hypothetical protein
MTEGLDRDRGACDRRDSRLRLIVHERAERRFTLTLINYGRNLAVALTAHASPGLLRWDIEVGGVIRAADSGSER